MSSEYGFHRLATSELTRLLRALHRGALPSPITRASLIEKAFGHIEAHLDLIIGRDVPSARAIVLAVLGERGTERREASSLSYQGVPAPGTRSRDLVDQVRELLASAISRVELYGLRLGDDRGLMRTVGALIAGRDARARLVFDLADGQTADEVRAFVRERVRAPESALEVFVSQGTRLRARVVVVDGERVLVTSGDLTSREEDDTIDVGVQLRDPEYVRALTEEWSCLVASGAVLPVP